MTDFRKKTSDSPHSVPGVKDDKGAYVPAVVGAFKYEGPLAIKEPDPEVSLDDILGKQLLALARVTKQLVMASSGGGMTKDEIQSLATCIKVTMDLKAKEKELLDTLTDEELEKAAGDVD